MLHFLKDTQKIYIESKSGSQQKYTDLTLAEFIKTPIKKILEKAHGPTIFRGLEPQVVRVHTRQGMSAGHPVLKSEEGDYFYLGYGPIQHPPRDVTCEFFGKRLKLVETPYYRYKNLPSDKFHIVNPKSLRGTGMDENGDVFLIFENKIKKISGDAICFATHEDFVSYVPSEIVDECGPNARHWVGLDGSHLTDLNRKEPTFLKEAYKGAPANRAIWFQSRGDVCNASTAWIECSFDSIEKYHSH